MMETVRSSEKSVNAYLTIRRQEEMVLRRFILHLNKIKTDVYFNQTRKIKCTPLHGNACCYLAQRLNVLLCFADC
jgi:hypothetical protein